MIRSMLRGCGLNKNKRLKIKLWAECANMCTQLINVLVDDPQSKCSHEEFYGSMPKWCRVSKLRGFGERCVTTKRKEIKGKLEDRGEIGMMVGYSDNHASGNHRVYMLKSGRVIETRDLQWLNMWYGD